MNIAQLDALIKTSAPIYGVDSNGGISFMPTATDAEKAAAETLMKANIGNLNDVEPDPSGFISGCKMAFGGVPGILSLPASVQSAISLTLSAISINDWADVQAYITSMEVALNTANPNVYAEIKAAAIQYNIPVTL